MHRHACKAVFVCALVLAGCGSDGPEGSKAPKMTLTTSSATTWQNLCKRVTLNFTDDNGAPQRFGRDESLSLTLTNAAAYGSNTCTGNPITVLNPGPDLTKAVFWINSTTLGPVTIDVSGAFSAEATLTTEVPTANLVLGQQDYISGTANQGGAVSGSTMKGPFGIERCAGMLLIADTGNNRVLGWSSTPTLNGQTADFVLGQATLTASAAVASQTGMSAPQGIACVNNALYVADYGNARILGYHTVPTTSGAAADFVFGQTSFTVGTAQTPSATTDVPSGLAFFGSSLVATNPNWHRVLIWNIAPTSGTSAPDNVIGQSSFTTQGASSSATGLNTPQNSRLREKYLIVADSTNNRVLVYDRATLANGATPTLVLGQPDLTTVTQGSSASELFFPSSADFDDDHLIVADAGNNRMLIWNGMPTYNGQPADVVIGSATFSAGSGAFSPITGKYRQFTLDGDSMWVSDYHHRVLRFAAP